MPTSKSWTNITVLLTTALIFDNANVISVISIADLGILISVILLTRMVITDWQLQFQSTAFLVTIVLTLLCFTRLLPLLFTDSTIGQFKYLITGILVAFIHITVSLTLTDRQDAHRIVRLIIISSVFISSINLLIASGVISVEWLPTNTYPTRTVAGVTIPMAYRSTVLLSFITNGVWSLAALTFCIGAIITRTIVSRRLAITALPLLLGNLIFAIQSRTVWIVLALVCLGQFSMLAHHYSLLSPRIKRSGIIGVIIGGILLLRPLLDLLIAIRPASITSRLAQYKTALQVFRHHPITGAPYGVIHEQTGNVLHNIYLQQFTFGGIIGGLLFLFLVIIVTRPYIALIYKRDSTIEEISIASYLIGLLVACAFFPAGTSYHFWLLISFAAVYIELPIEICPQPINIHSDSWFVERVVSLRNLMVLAWETSKIRNIYQKCSGSLSKQEG